MSSYNKGFEDGWNAHRESTQWKDAASKRGRELEAALGECIAVMKRNICPKPDVPDDHPYAVLKRASQVYYQDNARSGGLGD